MGFCTYEFSFFMQSKLRKYWRISAVLSYMHSEQHLRQAQQEVDAMCYFLYPTAVSEYEIKLRLQEGSRSSNKKIFKPVLLIILNSIIYVINNTSDQRLGLFADTSNLATQYLSIIPYSRNTLNFMGKMYVEKCILAHSHRRHMDRYITFLSFLCNL